MCLCIYAMQYNADTEMNNKTIAVSGDNMSHHIQSVCRAREVVCWTDNSHTWLVGVLVLCSHTYRQTYVHVS